MSTIKFAPNKSGALITVSTKNPAWGSLRLASELTAIDPTTGFIRATKKSFLIKDKVEGLTALLEANPNGLVGKLYTVEFIESETPADFKSLLNKNLSHEEAIANFVKRAGQDGPELTVGGERILRYTKYDPSNKQFDVVVTHDNQEEIARWRAVQDKGGANFSN
jgi:hypothetical protein